MSHESPPGYDQGEIGSTEPTGFMKPSSNIYIDVHTHTHIPSNGQRYRRHSIRQHAALGVACRQPTLALRVRHDMQIRRDTKSVVHRLQGFIRVQRTLVQLKRQRVGFLGHPLRREVYIGGVLAASTTGQPGTRLTVHTQRLVPAVGKVRFRGQTHHS